MTQTLLVFALVAFVGIATPGPTVLLALTNGSRFGLRASLPGMVGAVLCDVVLSVAYLAYLGVRLKRPTGRGIFLRSFFSGSLALYRRTA